MYITFLRSLQEYVSDVWSECTQFEEITKVHLHATKIVTGLTLPIFSSGESLYNEKE